MGQIPMEKEIKLTQRVLWVHIFLHLEMCDVVYPKTDYHETNQTLG